MLTRRDHPIEWIERFILASSAVTTGERNRLALLSDRGVLTRLAPGVYVDSADFSARSAASKHRERIYARILVTENPPTFGHASAAAMWRLPRIGSWPDRTHVMAGRTSGGRSTPGVIHHRVGHPDHLQRIEGVTVTSLARTVADLARFDSLATGIAAADVAIAGISLAGSTFRAGRDEIAAESRQRSSRGRARAEFVVRFADPASGSPGESLSRLMIHRAGFPRPELQARFADGSGEMFTDFFWPAFGLIGEFDGVGKYLRDEWTDGRSAAEVVIDEKRREDRLRALGPRVVRWGWDDALSVARMRRILTAAGLR